jgi:hypothetical protein
MYSTNLGTKIWSPLIYTYSKLKNGFFGPKSLMYPLSTRKKLFFSTLNLMILQTVWNECVRFGGHVNIQVSYKILQLEVLKKALILHNPTCFQEGLFWSNFGLHATSGVQGLKLIFNFFCKFQRSEGRYFKKIRRASNWRPTWIKSILKFNNVATIRLNNI